MTERAHLSIGEVLALLQEEFPDVSISKIRFLESQGLIEPQRTPSGYRQFFDEDTARLRWILMEQRDNFLPLKIIKERLGSGEFDRWYADGAIVPGSAAESQPTLFEPSPPPIDEVDLFDDDHDDAGDGDLFDDDDDDSGDGELFDDDDAGDGASAVFDAEEVAAELDATDDLDDVMADAEVHSLAEAALKRAAAFRAVSDSVANSDSSIGDPAPEFAADPKLDDPAAEPESATADAAAEAADPVADADPEPEPDPEPEATAEPEPEAADPAAHDVMLTAARRAASRAQTPRPDPVAPPPTRESPPAPSPMPEPIGAVVDGPLDAGPTSVSMTVEELSRSTGLSPAELGELERYGLLHSRNVGPAVYYDGDAMVVAKLAAAFLRHGVEARHLRMYKTAAEREAGVFEQVVAPMARRSDATSRREARDRLVEMARLGEALHAALLRLTLREYTDPR